MPLTLPDFVYRWRVLTLTERSASQSHFIDLCDVLGQQRPVEADQEGTFYTFEKGARKTGGGDGFADVWKRGCFAWEYKGKHKNLEKAYDQLLKYREDLENPPLLIVCDLDAFEVHTNFTGTVKRIYRFDLEDLLASKPTPTTHGFIPLEVLRVAFAEPQSLRPQRTTAQVTEAAAKEFASLADSLRKAGAPPDQAAHFLMRLLFCLFAEDIGLLPPKLFSSLVTKTRYKPLEFGNRLGGLFDAMSTGGYFGSDDIVHFDGERGSAPRNSAG